MKTDMQSTQGFNASKRIKARWRAEHTTMVKVGEKQVSFETTDNEGKPITVNQMQPVYQRETTGLPLRTYAHGLIVGGAPVLQVLAAKFLAEKRKRRGKRPGGRVCAPEKTYLYQNDRGDFLDLGRARPPKRRTLGTRWSIPSRIGLKR